MKKRSESGFTRHLIANIVLLLLVVFLILVFSGRKNYSRQIEQIDEYINALSSRTAQHVSDVFQDKLSSIRSIAYLYGQALGSAEVAPEYLAALEENSGFDRIRFIDREGISRASDGTTADVSDRDYYQKGLQGESGHTAVLASRFNGSKLVGLLCSGLLSGRNLRCYGRLYGRTVGFRHSANRSVRVPFFYRNGRPRWHHIGPISDPASGKYAGSLFRPCHYADR